MRQQSSKEAQYSASPSRSLSFSSICSAALPIQPRKCSFQSPAQHSPSSRPDIRFPSTPSTALRTSSGVTSSSANHFRAVSSAAAPVLCATVSRISQRRLSRHRQKFGATPEIYERENQLWQHFEATGELTVSLKLPTTLRNSSSPSILIIAKTAELGAEKAVCERASFDSEIASEVS